MSAAPWRASSSRASRNAQLWGVQPRAPGMSSQPSGDGWPGVPVRGYT